MEDSWVTFPIDSLLCWTLVLCVLTALVALEMVGVYACTLMKKRRYWPRFCYGDAINTCFANKGVGATAAVKGEFNGEPYNIWCMKEPDYVCKMFGTAGELHDDDEWEHTRVWTKNAGKERTTCQCVEPFSIRSKYHPSLDDHHNLHNQVLSIEETWAKTH